MSTLEETMREQNWELWTINLLLEKQSLSCYLKDEQEPPQCLSVILSPPLSPPKLVLEDFSLLMTGAGDEVSLLLQLLSGCPAGVPGAAGGWRPRAGWEWYPTSDKKRELFAVCLLCLPFQVGQGLLLLWPDLFLWGSSKLLIKHWK